MKRTSAIESVWRYFPVKHREILKGLSASERESIHEIRMRADRPLAAASFGEERYLCKSGGFCCTESAALMVSREDIEYSFKAICDYSVHSCGRELAEGFITVAGGHRIGICGSAVIKEGRLETVRYISGLNFRIAGQVVGCADELWKKVFADKPHSLLVAGAPASGKTTVLKDLCRCLGSAYRVSVIDERSEIAAVYRGQPQNDIGQKSDIFDGYPKAEGIRTAVRVMAPDIIVCDEIGGHADVRSIRQSLNSGVKFVATVHAGSVEELYSRRSIKKLIDAGAFDYIACLGNGRELGQIKYLAEVKP